MLALVLGKCQNSNMKNTQKMNDKKKLKIGDKVRQLVGCSYRWRDHGVIISVSRKKWLPYCPASDVAKMKNLVGDIFEVELDNLEKL